MTARATISPSRTTGRGVSSPTARIAACGGLITATNRRMPYIPRFETVNVPAESSGGVILPSRTRSASRRDSAAIVPRLFWSVEHGRDDQRILPGHGNTDVDATVELELP